MQVAAAVCNTAVICGEWQSVLSRADCIRGVNMDKSKHTNTFIEHRIHFICSKEIIFCSHLIPLQNITQQNTSNHISCVYQIYLCSLGNEAQISHHRLPQNTAHWCQLQFSILICQSATVAVRFFLFFCVFPPSLLSQLVLCVSVGVAAVRHQFLISSSSSGYITLVFPLLWCLIVPCGMVTISVPLAIVLSIEY